MKERDQKQNLEDEITDMLEKVMKDDHNESYLSISEDNNGSFLQEPINLRQPQGKAQTVKPKVNYKNMNIGNNITYQAYPEIRHGHDFHNRGVIRKAHTISKPQNFNANNIYFSQQKNLNMQEPVIMYNNQGVNQSYYNNNSLQSNNCDGMMFKNNLDSLMYSNKLNSNSDSLHKIQNSFNNNINNNNTYFSSANQSTNLESMVNNNNLNTYNNNIMFNNSSLNVSPNNFNINYNFPNNNFNLHDPNYINKLHNVTFNGSPNTFVKKQLSKNNLIENKNNKLNIKNGISQDMVFSELEHMLSVIDKIDEYLFNQLCGKFIKIIKTQNGSKVFQKYLKNTSMEIIHNIFIEILDKLNFLMIDSYANYFCQKFFGYLSKEDRFLFLKQIQPNLINIAISKIGTYPLQGLIEQINSNIEIDIIINAIKDYILEMCQDIYGTHVIEKIIMCLSEEYISFLYQIILDNFMVLANHCNGLCVVKKIVIHSNKKETVNSILSNIVDNMMYLIQNPYGNYVIQVAFEVI